MPSLKKDLLSALDEPAFHDVTLVGTDHEEPGVPATKVFLAARSPVFHSMFFGNFQERSHDRVELNYPTLVLKVLVKYCYSDDLDLKMIFSTNRLGATELSDKEAVLLVHLRDAANYFELIWLHRWVSNVLGRRVAQDNNVLCVCAALAELFARGETEGPMWDILILILQQESPSCLVPKLVISDSTEDNSENKIISDSELNRGIVTCSLPFLRKIMTPAVDPFAAVKAIQKWKEANPIMETSQDETTLKEIANSINVDSIQSTDLAKIKPCEVFPMDMLYQALVENAIEQEKNKTTFSPTVPPFKVKVAFVQGAGVESVNGYYTARPGKPYSFFKNADYGGIPSTYEIDLRHGVKSKKWQIKVGPGGSPPEKDANGFHFGTKMEEKEREEFVLYKSEPIIGATNLNSENIPFALWQCSSDNHEPAPYVAILMAALSANSNNT